MQLPVTVKDQEVDFIFVGSGFFFFFESVFFSPEYVGKEL